MLRTAGWMAMVLPIAVSIAIALASTFSPPIAGAQSQVVSRLFAATSEGPFITYSWGEHWTRLREERKAEFLEAAQAMKLRKNLHSAYGKVG